MTRSRFRSATNAAGREQVERDERRQTDDRHRVAEPARAVSREEDRQRGEGRRHRRDRDRDVQAQLGPAVGILVEREPQHGGREDDHRQGDQRERRDKVDRRPATDLVLEEDEDAAGEGGGRDELEVAAPGVVAVRHPGGRERVQAPEQVRELETDEQRDDASTATSTTSASGMPSDRASPNDVGGAAAPSEAASTAGMPRAATPGGLPPARRRQR